MSTLMAEFLGTALLVYLGDATVASCVLNKTKGQNAGWLAITTGWAFALALPALIFGGISGFFNPVFVIAMAIAGKFPMADVPAYVAVEMLGGFVGAVLVWLSYLPHWAETDDKPGKLAIFCTGPAIRNTPANLLIEVFATFILIFCILGLGTVQMAPGLGAFFVGIVLWSIGLSLGSPTGYSMNPARDLAPRIAHAILPIAGKGDSDWGYSWIPVLGAMIGALLAVFAFIAIF